MWSKDKGIEARCERRKGVLTPRGWVRREKLMLVRKNRDRDAEAHLRAGFVVRTVGDLRTRRWGNDGPWDSNEEHGDANDDTDSFSYSQKSSMA
jgi:hypothetical protein